MIAEYLLSPKEEIYNTYCKALEDIGGGSGKPRDRKEDFKCCFWA